MGTDDRLSSNYISSNNVNAPLPQAPSNIPSYTTDGLEELQEKIRQSIQRLKAVGEDDPEFELFHKKLTRFYDETTSPDVLADHLLQNDVLSKYQRDKIKTEKMDYDKNSILYNIVLRKKAVSQLIPALKNSGNKNVLKIIEELVLENQYKYETSNECRKSTSSRQGRNADGFPNATNDRIEFYTGVSSEFFCGRKDFIVRLHSKLEPENLTSTKQNQSKPIVITGLPGIGKTQTVLKYIENYKGSYDHIIWINAEEVDAATNNVLQLAAVTKIDTKFGDKPKDVCQLIQDIYDRLSMEKLLVIYDDAKTDDRDKWLDKILPARRIYGRQVPAIIVTSRNKAWEHLNVTELPKFTVDECLSLLRSQINLEDIGANNEQVFEEIKQVCGGLPILIQQVIIVINEENAIRREFHKAVYTMQAFLEDVENEESEVIKAVVDGGLKCYSIFKTAFDRLRAKPELGKLALKCLYVMSLLNPDHIPKLLFLHLMEKCPEINRWEPPSAKTLNCCTNFESRLYGALKLLWNSNMITHDDCKSFYQINRMVQTIKLEEHSRTNNKVYCQQEMENLVNSFNDYLNKMQINNEPSVNEILDNGWRLYRKAEKELGKGHCTHFRATLLASKKIALEEVTLEEVVILR